MATRRMPAAAKAATPDATPSGGFDAWQRGRRGSQEQAALEWRAAYHQVIATEEAGFGVMELLLDGYKKSLWKLLQGPDGKAFSDFPTFCATEPPHGLGKPVDDLRRFRRMLGAKR